MYDSSHRRTGLTNLAHLDISAKPPQYGPWLKVTGRLIWTIWQLWRAALRGRVCVRQRYKKKIMFLQPARLLFLPLISFSSLSTSACYYAAWQLNRGVICVTKQEFYPRESLGECFTKQDKTRGSVATHSLWVRLLQAVYVFWKRRMGKREDGEMVDVLMLSINPTEGQNLTINQPN